jgi:hypothetical protein
MDRDFLLDLFSEFGPVSLRRMFRAFSSEVDTGSREENASKQKDRARS